MDGFANIGTVSPMAGPGDYEANSADGPGASTTQHQMSTHVSDGPGVVSETTPETSLSLQDNEKQRPF